MIVQCVHSFGRKVWRYFFFFASKWRVIKRSGGCLRWWLHADAVLVAGRELYGDCRIIFSGCGPRGLSSRTRADDWLIIILYYVHCTVCECVRVCVRACVSVFSRARLCPGSIFIVVRLWRLRFGGVTV